MINMKLNIKKTKQMGSKKVQGEITTYFELFFFKFSFYKKINI